MTVKHPRRKADSYRGRVCSQGNPKVTFCVWHYQTSKGHKSGCKAEHPGFTGKLAALVLNSSIYRRVEENFSSNHTSVIKYFKPFSLCSLEKVSLLSQIHLFK